MAAPRPETFVRLTDIVADLILSRLGNSGTDLSDDLFTKINTALAIPGELTVAGTNKVVSVGATQVVTGPSGKLKSLPPLNAIDLGNRTGTFDFATGTGTGDVQNTALPVMVASQFIKAGFEVRENGNVVVIFGNQGATAAAATLPSFSENALPLGYVVLQDDGTGGTGNFVNVLYSALYQFVGAGGGGGSEQSEAQDRNLKMVRGGTWLWNSVTGTLSWSSDAAIQIPGLTEARNNILAGSVNLAADGQVAYVEVNRTSGGALNLTVQTSLISALNDTPNTVVIARRIGNDVLVGNGTFLLKNGERLELDGALAEINRYFNPLRLSAHESVVSKVRVGGTDQTLLNGVIISQELRNLLMNFDGAVINFQTGAILAADDATPLGQNFTPFTIPVGEYFWYGVAVIPSTVNADNRITGQILITPAVSSNAVQASAPLPAIGGTKKLGAILVQNVAGTITLVQVRQLGVGSGSGSGTGDANSLLEDLKRRLEDSYFDWVTPNIFSTSEDDLVSGTSTASFDVANTLYKFTTPGQILLSIQQFGAAFLASDRNALQFELHTQWNVDDPGAVCEVSRDGGLNWGTFDMVRIGDSDKRRGILVLPDEPVNKVVLKSYDVANADGVATYNSTLKKIGIKLVVPASTKLYMKDLTVYLNKSGSPSGSLFAKIVKDVSGVPSEAVGDLVAGSVDQLAVSGLGAGNVSGVIDMPAVLPAGDYWAVVYPDQTYIDSVSSGQNLAYRKDGSSPTYADGDMAVYGVSSWQVSGGNDACFSFDGVPFDLRVRITSSVSGAELDGYGIFYGEAGPFTAGLADEYQRIDFSGDLDQTTFQMTNFLPDPKRLLVFDVNNGQVYHYPAFAVDGHNVVFAAGTFLSPGENISLVFRHLGGNGAYDNSDENAALMAANHLGAVDDSISRALPGRGIILMRPDGTKRELTINDSDLVEIKSVP